MLPLYEAKMIHHYDTKWATYEPDGSTRDVTPDEKRDPEFFVMPRYWVHEAEVDKKLDGKWDKTWMLGWRRIARSTDERTLLTTMLPKLAYGDSVFLLLPSRAGGHRGPLQAALTSFVFDFATRQKMGGTNANFFLVEQLPVPQPSRIQHLPAWVGEHVDRLNGQRLDAGSAAQLRADLDALMFHVYGISRADSDYILETFPIVKKKDIAAHGEYRTKRLILEAYDRLEGTSNAH